VHTIVLGAGALGSVISAYLTRAGEDVTLLARGPRATLLQAHGVAVTGVEDFTAPVTVTTRPHDLRKADVLIVTVKTYDTEPVLASINHLDVGSVFSLQNGVLKNEQLAHYFGWEKTLGASPLFSAQVTPAGPVHFTYHGGMVLGEFSGTMSPRVQTIAAMLERAGMCPVIAPQIQTVEWSKYVSFVGWMAVAALTRLETHKFLTDPDLAALVARLIRETAQLAAHHGIPLEDHEPFLSQTLSSVPLAEAVERLRHLGRRLATQSPTHKVSTLQDLERGRRLEVEEILGYAVQHGEALGIPLPTVETCYRLLAGVNRYLQ
jgi:2-dehydropantoate 2-reductase